MSQVPLHEDGILVKTTANFDQYTGTDVHVETKGQKHEIVVGPTLLEAQATRTAVVLGADSDAVIGARAEMTFGARTEGVVGVTIDRREGKQFEISGRSRHEHVKEDHIVVVDGQQIVSTPKQSLDVAEMSRRHDSEVAYVHTLDVVADNARYVARESKASVKETGTVVLGTGNLLATQTLTIKAGDSQAVQAADERVAACEQALSDAITALEEARQQAQELKAGRQSAAEGIKEGAVSAEGADAAIEQVERLQQELEAAEAQSAAAQAPLNLEATGTLTAKGNTAVVEGQQSVTVKVGSVSITVGVADVKIGTAMKIMG